MEVIVKSKLVMMAALSSMLALAAAPAAAQAPDNAAAPAAPVFQINASFLPDQTPTAAGEAISFDDQARGAAPKTHAMGDRQIFVRVEGGLVFCCSSTGFMVGVGVSGQPKSVKNLEIAGDFGFGRLFGTNLIYIAADGLYDFHMEGHDAMPYAGAGLGIVHAAGVTKTAFQILGGVQLPVTGPHVARVEVRFVFFSAATTTLLLGSYSF
jgi:opacity protein-like surface antigen